MCDQIACWASAGHGISGCQALETQLRTCMDTPVSFLTTLCFGIRGWGKAQGKEDGWMDEQVLI